MRHPLPKTLSTSASTPLLTLAHPHAPSLPANPKIVFELDWSRLAQFSIMAALYVGPAVHYWFGFLDRMITHPPIAKRFVSFVATRPASALCFSSSPKHKP